MEYPHQPIADPEGEGLEDGTPSSAAAAVVYEMKVVTPSLSVGCRYIWLGDGRESRQCNRRRRVALHVDGLSQRQHPRGIPGPITVDHTARSRQLVQRGLVRFERHERQLYDAIRDARCTRGGSPPTITVPGLTVTMSAMPTGTTIRYTTDAATPTASSPVYTSQLSVSATTTVKAKAFHPDYAASPETSRTYTIITSLPTIDPPTGVYTSTQEVTMTAPSGPRATVRYTLDGSQPTDTSTRTRRRFLWTPGRRSKPARSRTTLRRPAPSPPQSSRSATVPWPRGQASPEGGVYATAQVITLSAGSGATIHIDRWDRSHGDIRSLCEPCAIAFSDSRSEARASHGLGDERRLNQEYVLDTAAPTITAHRFPSSLDGWHLTPVTVSIQMRQDTGEITSCCRANHPQHRGRRAIDCPARR